MKRVIAIPDLHLPFHSADALKRLFESIEDVEPDVVIQLGDLFDLYSMSRFPIDRNIITPKDELLEARSAAGPEHIFLVIASAITLEAFTVVFIWHYAAHADIPRFGGHGFPAFSKAS